MSKHQPGTLEALAEVIAARVKGAKPAKPVFRVIKTARPTVFDSITRECILRRVRYLARAYKLQWQVDQATFNVVNLDCLEDPELRQLLKDMERARECLAEGIAFDEMGLVRSNADDMNDWYV